MLLNILIALAAIVSRACAIGQDTCVSFNGTNNTSFPVVANGQAVPIFLSNDDWPGVQRTAEDFANDIEAVTGVAPSLQNISASSSLPSQSIIIGTLGHSSLVDSVLNYSKLDVSSINGSWESFVMQEVKDPLPGVATAFVIIGSDKRGTIFGLYDLSEQMGVSPWYWYVYFYS